MNRSILDDVDWQIITRLNTNARVSNREIARQIGMNETTVRVRLKRMLKEKLIRVTAVTDISRLTNPVLAYLWIDVEISADLQSVAREIAEIPEITYVAALVGRADILAMTLVKDAEQLIRFLHESIDRVAGIRATRYTLIQNFIKHDARFTAILE